MLRKYVVAAAALTTLGISATSPALAADRATRTAIVSEYTTGIGVYFVETGEAAEADVVSGPLTTINADCRVGVATTHAGRPDLFRIDPECSVYDATTRTHHPLTVLNNGPDFAAAYGSFTVHSDHTYRLCVGFLATYGGGSVRSTQPCKTLA